MKEKILQILRETDGFVSGQEICHRLNVSRTYIWKMIHQLQEEGYEIEAVPQKGYRLKNSPDTMSAWEVKSRLTTKVMGQNPICFDVTDSTNTQAKLLAEKGAAEGTLVIADRQDGGKGRRGRSWETPSGSAIAMSLIVRPQIEPQKVSAITLVMGMAVTKACRELYGKDFRIKWPNDVVYEGRKLCGILTEMSTDMDQIHYVVIGTGINVNMESFPEEIKDTASSLRLVCGEPKNRAQLIAEICRWFETYYEIFVRDQDLSTLKDEYDRMLVNVGRTVLVLDSKGSYEAQAIGIDEAGELIVECDGERKTVFSGEVSVRGIYGYV